MLRPQRWDGCEGEAGAIRDSSRRTIIPLSGSAISTRSRSAGGCRSRAANAFVCLRRPSGNMPAAAERKRSALAISMRWRGMAAIASWVHIRWRRRAPTPGAYVTCMATPPNGAKTHMIGIMAASLATAAPTQCRAFLPSRRRAVFCAAAHGPVCHTPAGPRTDVPFRRLIGARTQGFESYTAKSDLHCRLRHSRPPSRPKGTRPTSCRWRWTV